MRTPVVTYGDIILGGATLYDWELTSGVAPSQRVFTVTGAISVEGGGGGGGSYVPQAKADAPPATHDERMEALRGLLGKPATLRIEGPRRTLDVHQLYLLEVQPGEDPFTSRIRLADVRWMWPKAWISSSYNVKWATGDRHLFGNNRIENKILQPGLRYARWSLKPRTSPTDAWKARDVAPDVLEQINSQLGLDTKMTISPKLKGIEVQDLFAENSGEGAMELALTQTPGADLYVDYEGRVQVYDTQGQGELALADKLKAPQRGGGTVRVVDKSALRPREIIVLFTPEVELRLDYEEPTSGSAVPEEDTRTLENVAPIPDITLTIGENNLARGSIVPLDDLFTAWGAFGILNKAVSFDALRKHALRYGWASFVKAWGHNPQQPPDAVNLARAQAAAHHHRRTFRIDKYFTQRIESIRPYRASIINPDTGAYAPAEVYSDWTRRPSIKGFSRLSDANTDHGWAVRGHADQLEDGKVAPARVNVLDEQAGVIEVLPQVDPYGLSQAMFLGYPADGLLPSEDAGKANRTGQELYARWDQVTLEEGWEMSVVLTVVPASPNDIRRFHQVKVPASKIEPGVGECTGPPVYARVFPGVMTARFGWQDDQAEAITQAFKGEGADWPTETLLNGKLVEDVAQAAARRIYEGLRDRPQGSAVIDMDPDIEPTGTLSGVRHVMQSGATMTELKFKAARQPADIWRYLNASTRRAIFRVLNNPTGAK